MLAAEDKAGQAWCREHGYRGYTSYASLDDLPQRASVFGELKRRLDRHAARFASDLAFDLGPRGRLKLDSPVGERPDVRRGPLRPYSPAQRALRHGLRRRAAGRGRAAAGGSALAADDGRPAPPADAPPSAQSFVTLIPQAGALYMWESWLRHEVLPGRTKTPRVSLSFNYAWK